MTAAIPVNEEAVVKIAGRDLKPSPFNPRKTYDEASIAELGETIKSFGLLQRPIVRRVGDDYEVVFGHRRRLAMIAAFGEDALIPCVLKSFTDDEALEVQIIENSQRVDVHPLEEADGFRMLADRGVSAEEIAHKVGRSTRFVLQRIALTKLIPAAREKVESGDMSLGAAVLIAQLKDFDQQTALDRTRYNCTAGQVRTFIAGLHPDLSKAQFSRKLENLIPEVPACINCPKNTLCSPALFVDDSEPKEGLCTDRECFLRKANAHAQNQLAKVAAKDPDVVPVSAKYRTSLPGVLAYETYHYTEKEGTPAVIVESDNAEEIGKKVFIRVYESRKAELDKAKGGDAAAAIVEEEKAKRALRLEELRKQRVENLARHNIWQETQKAIASAKKPVFTPEIIRAMILKLLESNSYSQTRQAKYNGPAAQEVRAKYCGTFYDPGPSLEQMDRVAALPMREALLAAFNAACMDEIAFHDFYKPSGFALLTFAEAFGIDVEHIRKEADMELAPKRKKGEPTQEEVDAQVAQFVKELVTEATSEDPFYYAEDSEKPLVMVQGPWTLEIAELLKKLHGIMPWCLADNSEEAKRYAKTGLAVVPTDSELTFDRIICDEVMLEQPDRLAGMLTPAGMVVTLQEEAVSIYTRRGLL